MNAQPLTLILKKLGDASLDAVVASNQAGEIVFWNERATECFGWTYQEAMNCQVHELLIPIRLRQAHLSAVQKLENVETPPPSRYVVDALHKNGFEMEVELSLIHLEIGPDRITICFARDVGAERDKSRMTGTTNNRAIHLTRVNAMSTMAAALAHELAQPLAAASNFLTAAQGVSQREGLASDDLTWAIDGSSRSVKRASDILSSIRSMVTKQHAQVTTQSLTEMVAEALRLLESRIRCTVDVQIEPSAESVLADRIKVEQILLNLVRNALDALSDRTDAAIRISASKIEEAVHVAVEDNGPGLSQESEERLFQAMRSAKANGMGMGLAISRALIESLNGRIWVEQKSSPGVRICFSLPAVASA